MNSSHLSIKKTTLTSGSGEPTASSNWEGLFILIILVVLCLIPVFIIIGVLMALYHSIAPKKERTVENPWLVIRAETGFELRYQYVELENIPECIGRHFDEAPTFVFDVNPKITFFEGYFTDLMIEQPDGIFVQKIILNPDGDAVQAAPLYFFNYSTQETDELMDLNGYEPEFRGNADDFIIHAYNNNESLEIRIKNKASS